MCNKELYIGDILLKSVLLVKVFTKQNHRNTIIMWLKMEMHITVLVVNRKVDFDGKVNYLLKVLLFS